MNIPFIDLKAQYKLIKKQVQAKMDAVLEHGAYVMGPEIQELEQQLARFCGQKHALACSSGTDALILALLGLGIKPGDAVFTTPFTFFATAEAAAFIGAIPVFVDIDPQTFNMNPESLQQAISALKGKNQHHPLPETGGISDLGHQTPTGLNARAVISVDLFGLPCDYDAIEEICTRENLDLIVDAAQSFGALFKGKSTCAMGSISCTSFFPAKPLGCYGDGGMCFTEDQELLERLLSLRVHGQGRDRYENIRLGMNARMDTLQAAVLLAKMELFPQELELRTKIAAGYNTLLGASNGLTLPLTPENSQSAWAQYSLLARDDSHRQTILESLKKQGIPWAIYYTQPLHLQKSFAYLGYKQGDFPVSEEMSRRIFSLPMHPYLDDQQLEFIAGAVLSGAH